MALAHFADRIIDGSNPLASQISRWCSVFSGFMPRGTLNVITLNDLVLNSAVDPSFLHNFFWLDGFESQLAVSSESTSITVPPLLEMTTAHIFPVGVPN